jgi:pimeloyl-ACP methyl ester carboxylesterase
VTSDQPKSARPEWLDRALATEPECDRITVAGVGIARMMWGEPGRPGLVLVHGGAAHTHWWSFIAPLLPQYRVVAMDLSGHGDSDRRPEYRIDMWTEEVLAAASAGGADFEGKPVVIGHSMGGFVATATAARAGDDLAGAIILDSPMVAEDPEVEAARLGEAFGAPKTYPDFETAISRFRTVPRQDHYEPHIIDHIARHSVRAVEGGYTWKFDPKLFAAISRSAAAEYLPRVSCRFALLRSEHGLVTPEIGAVMYERLGRVAPVVEIPLAGHHMMLDQPLLLVTALRALLADWEHSVPFHR